MFNRWGGYKKDTKAWPPLGYVQRIERGEGTEGDTRLLLYIKNISGREDENQREGGSTKLLFDRNGHLGEGVLDVGRVLRRCLEEVEVKLIGKLLSVLGGDLALRDEIALVADEQLVHVLAGISVNLLEPLLHVGEGLLVGDVVDDDDTVSTAVVT